VWIAREDELGDPEVVILAHQIRDLLMTADESGAGAAAQYSTVFTPRWA
jgi:hypothetical protein